MTLQPPPQTGRHRGALGRILCDFLDEPRGPHDLDETPLTELTMLWVRASRRDPAIGLHLFSRFQERDWHILAHVSSHAPTLGESMAVYQRYSRLSSEIENPRLVIKDGLHGIEINIDAPEPLRQFMVEHCSAIVIGMARISTGVEIQPARAEFAYPKPDYHPEYTRLLGPNVTFDAERNGLYFAKQTFDLPMIRHHRGFFALLTRGLDEQLSKLRVMSGWVGIVAQALRKEILVGRSFDIDSIAALLHVSPRTLRRRLEDEGSSYRLVIDIVLAELDTAFRLQGLTVAQTASRLGYSSTSAYLHARKRWEKPQEPLPGPIPAGS